MRRFALSLATLLVAGSVVIPAAAASAGTHARPVITATQVTFTIPSSPTGLWKLSLETKNSVPNQALGVTKGTSGTLSLPVPQTLTCDFQADVQVKAGGVGKYKFYSGIVATVPGCGQSGTGPRLTPGYWKTHETATTALLPQQLGSYTVATFADSTAVFDAMKCSDAVNCLAGHLLAAELDVAGGSSICISGVIYQAGQFLKQVKYNGPGSYAISVTQRVRALALEVELDTYTNDSTSTSC
jgi:hypothetical protein